MKKTLISVLIMTLVMTFSFTMPGMAFADDEQDAVRFGTVEEYSTFESGSILEDAYYYDDSWFSKSGTERNDALALVSMQLTATAIENDKDERCAEFLDKLGFEVTKSVSLSADNDAFGYTLGMKKVGDDTLAAMVVHSYALEKGSKETAWIQNFTINGENHVSGEQYAYQQAVNKFDAAALKKEMEAYGGGELKLWIMGQSRGGAIADLIAKKVREQVTSADNIFAYTFEAPAVADKDLAEDADCGYIHNYVTGDDIVTMVPPWGMKRYGREYDLKAELADKGIELSDINDILTRLGSKAKLDENSILNDLDPKDIIKVLEGGINSRADYSKDREDKFKSLKSKKDVTVKYNYQNVFRKLMKILFGENSIDITGVSDHLIDILSSLDSFIRGYMIEAGEIEPTGVDINAYYWDSAAKVWKLLDSFDSEEGNLPLSKAEIYAFLKLAAPIAINKSVIKIEGNEITDEPLESEVIINYLTPLLNIAVGAKDLTMSHNYDVIIARLKALTSYPDAGDIAVDIVPPSAGDPASRISKTLAAGCEDMGISWLSASAKWETEDKTLRKNKVYYLNAEFEIIGHNVPDNMNVTINGEKPIKSPDVTYRDGVSTVKGIWRFVLGSPEECVISFSSYGEAEALEPIEMPFGEVLKYVKAPEMADEGNNAFGGWLDVMSTPWEKTTVTGDLTFYAEWITLIDLVEVTFDIPQEGQTVWKSPVPVAPEYANYYIERVKLYDENYNEVTEVMPSGEVSLNFNVVPSVEAKFVLKGNSFGDYDYAGKVKVNGKKADFYYQSDSNYLSVEYKFKPKTAPTMGEDGTAIGKGASASIAREYLTNWLSDKDPKGSEFAPLKLKSSKQTKSSITLNWTKSKKATKYVVYGNLSGSENKLKKIKNVKGKSTTIKKIGKTLKKGRYYKFMVVALDKNNKVVSTSKMIHVSTKGSAKAANYKGLKIKVKKTDGKYKAVKKITLKKGKSAQIKATVTKASKKVKVKSILKIRYESSDINVAKVSSKGKITAKGKGTCTIYVYTQNGVRKTVKVTVK